MDTGGCGSLEERYSTHAHFIDGNTEGFTECVVNQNQNTDMKLDKWQFLYLSRFPIPLIT